MSNAKQATTETRIVWRTNALFRAMASDYLLREQFVTDPAQIFFDYVFGKDLSAADSDIVNQLIFSVVSNASLRQWMGAYGRRVKGGAPSRHAFALEFAKAAATSRDERVMLAMIRSASEDHAQFAVQADLLRAIIAIVGRGSAAGGTEQSPGGGTEISPGGGTEMSPGALQRAELIRAALRNAESLIAQIIRAESAGTEQSPGGGTEQSPGGGTEMSPGALGLAARLTVEVRNASRLVDLFARAASGGTEMSPGGGTEISPGGGTEMSPGALQRAELLRAALISVDRLSVALLRAESGGTEQSPGGGTEKSPGGGTEMSPGALSLAERLSAEIRLAVRVGGELLRAAVAGTEMSPGGGTEISPGGGTEMSPGALQRAELIRAALRNAESLIAQIIRAESAGTEQSPGGGTEQSPGGGTEMSPGALGLAARLTVEVRNASRLVDLFARAASGGTEMSPGGGTEISPGGGTEMSPGALQRAELLRAALISVDRLSVALLRAESGGTEQSPGGGTEKSPGGGTEMSPGALSLAERLSAEIRLAVRVGGELLRAAVAGTEMSPGGGTEISPGGGTEMSPGALQRAEQLTARLLNAERLSVALLRADSGGTEKSPGGGTEKSPGGGTEKSPGAISLTDRLITEVRLAARLSAEIVRAQAGGTEMSPGGGTEISPGGGTEMSPGALRRAELLVVALRNAERLGNQLLRSAGTEVSPGGGTEVSPGGGTEVSPGGGTEVSPGGGTEVSPGGFSLVERLTFELNAAGRIGAQILRDQVSGTEMSPGTATEMSPGIGTDKSPGAVGQSLWGVALPSHVLGALSALVQYAGLLRSQGALNTSGLEGQ